MRVLWKLKEKNNAEKVLDLKTLPCILYEIQ